MAVALRALAACTLGMCVLAGCAPELDDRLSRIDAPRVLAISATPAEQAPGKEVALELLYASPDNAPPPRLDWAFCTERKALAAPGAVSADCLLPAGSALAPIGEGKAVKAALPDDACRLFGPDPPEPVAGQPAGRPADPDASGGYYQPLRVRVAQQSGAVYVTAAVRIACGLPGATPEQALEMARRYRRNERPAVRSLSLVRGAETIDVAPDSAGAEPSVTVAPGETITWRAAWDACPTAPVCGDGVCGADEDAAGCAVDCAAPNGCSGAEEYVLFDPELREIRARREAIQVSWYATAGSFEVDRTGRSAGEDAPGEAAPSDTDNAWTAPGEEGDVTLWAVIRDDRGGAGWQRYSVRVAR